MKPTDEVKVTLEPELTPFLDRLREIFEESGVDAKLGPQNRAQGRAAQRRMVGHTPGPRHRPKAAKRYCPEVLQFGDRSMTCGAQLPTYRDRCLWHGSDEPVVMFGREWLVDGRVTGRTVFREAEL